MKLTSSMSSSKLGSSSSSSSSECSDNDKSENRDLVIPSPVIPTDSDDDGVSLSQHKLAMKKQMADNYVVPNSTSGSDEEEEEENASEEEIEQSADGQTCTLFESTSTTSIFSRFTKISRQFAEMMEMHRKQQLFATKKPVLASLSFDQPPSAKSRKLKSPFSPKRSAAYIIGATQADEDFERDILPHCRLAPLHVFIFRRNLSKSLRYSRTNPLLRKSTSASAT